MSSLPLALLALSSTTVSVAQTVPSKPAWQTTNWAQWRGPQQSGVSLETGLADGWPEAGPQQVWRAPLGQGFSGVSVVDGRLYTQLAAADDAFLVSLSATDGKERWRVRTGVSFKDSFGNGPRATPSVDGAWVYALSANGDLVAVRADDGTVGWRHDLTASFGARRPQWGHAASPLVDGEQLIVQSGGDAGRSVLAFNKTTGALLWSARDDKAGYAAPLIVDAAGTRQLLIFAGDKLVSMNPANGATYWEYDWKTDWGVNASQPIVIDADRIFLSSAYDRGAALLRVRKNEPGLGVEELWRSREMRNKFSSTVLFEGSLYGFDESTLRCLDPETGKTRWAQRGLGIGSLLIADGKLLVLSDSGLLVLARATPEKYDELSRTQVFKSKTWTVPTLAGGRLYLRDEKEIVVLDISK